MKAFGVILLALSGGLLYLVLIKKQSITQIWQSVTSFFTGSTSSSSQTPQQVSSAVATKQATSGKFPSLGMLRAMQPNG